MKLKNKKTGEIKEISSYAIFFGSFDSLKEINNDWEDHEEPKGHYWVIDEDGVLECRTVGDFSNEGMCKQIGSYFKTDEEAKKAVERLKALANLRKDSFQFTGWRAVKPDNDEHFKFIIGAKADSAAIDDLSTLFNPDD